MYSIICLSVGGYGTTDINLHNFHVSVSSVGCMFAACVYVDVTYLSVGMGLQVLNCFCCC